MDWAIHEYPTMFTNKQDARKDLMNFIEEFDALTNVPWEPNTDTDARMYEAWAVSVMTREAGGDFDLQDWIVEKYALEHDSQTPTNSIKHTNDGGEEANSFTVSAEGE